MVPSRLDSARKLPNAVVVVEVEAALGTVLVAGAPAEGFKRLVSRQKGGSTIAGGRSWDNRRG